MFIPEQVHKSQIRAGDIIPERGRMVTLCARDIKRDSLMGITIRGDSYVLGRRLVTRLRQFRVVGGGACNFCG